MLPVCRFRCANVLQVIHCGAAVTKERRRGEHSAAISVMEFLLRLQHILRGAGTTTLLSLLAFFVSPSRSWSVRDRHQFGPHAKEAPDRHDYYVGPIFFTEDHVIDAPHLLVPVVVDRRTDQLARAHVSLVR